MSTAGSHLGTERRAESTFQDVLERELLAGETETAFRFFQAHPSDSVTLSRADLLRGARCIAATLQLQGLTNERALLFAEPGFDFLRLFCGCLLAKVIPVPLPVPRPRRGMQRVSSVIDDCDPRAVLCTTSTLPRIQANDELTTALCGRSVLTHDELMHGEEAAYRDSRVRSEDLALLQYTSGSTGIPKGVRVRHSNLLANVQAMADRLACTPNDKGVSWLPHFHDMGLMGGILLPLYAGFETVLFSPVTFVDQPLVWLETIQMFGGTITGGPNFAYDICAQRASDEEAVELDLSTWRLAFSGSEMVRADVLDRFASRFSRSGFRRSAFLPCYGMAEATLFVSGRSQDEELRVLSLDRNELKKDRAVPVSDETESAKQVVSCGRVSDGHQIVIAHPRQPVQFGEQQIGEVCLAGPSVTDGYWSAAFHYFEPSAAENGAGPAQRYLRTGDLGFLEQGELFLTGRKKDLIILRGMNLYPDDLEAVLEASHPAINRNGAVAFAIERNGREHAAAVIEVRREARRTVNLDDLFDAARQAVADEYTIQLSAIVAVTPQQIPRTSSGKKQRRRAAEMFEADQLQGVLGRWQIASWDAASTTRQLPLAGSAEAVAAETGEAPSNEASIAVPARNGHSVPSQTQFAPSSVNGSKAMPPVLEPIAVIGMACRFPGANDLSEFEQLLESGGSGISTVPADRWNSAKLEAGEEAVPGKLLNSRGGYVDGIADFDPEFFGMTPREVRKMDPQQRLLLEISFRALDDAGLTPQSLAGSPTGVFVGIGNSDYTTLNVLAAPAFREVDAYSGTGNAHSLAANRLSYILGLHGPSLALDTACSSSLVALHAACQSLRAGECEMAFVGGVNAILSPVVSIAFSNAHMLSPDGVCSPFDAGANGYVRSEGCGVILLKPLSQAQRDGDRVLGVIQGTATNHVGRTSGITVPDAEAQQRVMLDALNRSQLTPADLSYIEAHGTGTPLGDPIELDAIRRVFESTGFGSHPCLFGSVKGNVGHLETASAMASLIKVLLMLKRRKLYPQANLKTINPRINLSGTKLEPSRRLTDWNHADKLRAGISSFGFGGANAHAVLVEPPPVANVPEVTEPKLGSRPLHLLAVSAHTAEALPRVAASYAEWIRENEELDLSGFCRTVNIARSGYAFRTMLSASNRDELLSQLDRISGRPFSSPPVDPSSVRESKIAFLCTGQGAQAVEMGRELYETEPVFRRELDRCATILDQYLDRPFLSLLYPDQNNAATTNGEHNGQHAPSTNLIDLTQYAQPALFAIEWSLAQMWKSWGLKPDMLLGHSVGEYVAACLAGVFSLEDGLRLIAERGRLMGTLTSGGSMAVVMTSLQKIEPLLAEYQGRIDVAAVNGPRLTNLSGDAEAIREIVERLQSERIRCQQLNVSQAFHSYLLEPILDQFEEFAKQFPFQAPKIPLISNVTGEFFRANEVPDASYWRRHARGAVQFEQGMKTLVGEGCRAFLEIGPAPNLTSMGRTCVPSGKTRWLTTLRPQQPDWSVLSGSLQSLYEDGWGLNFRQLESRATRGTTIPEYPYKRERYWLAPKDAWYESPGAGGTNHPLLGRHQVGTHGETYESELGIDRHPWLKDHRVLETPVFPAAGFVELGLAAAKEMHGSVGSPALQLEQLTFERMLSLPGKDRLQLRFEMVDAGSGRRQFHVHSRNEDDCEWNYHCSGRIVSRGLASGRRVDLEELLSCCPNELDSEKFYATALQHGLDYQGRFRALRNIRTGEGVAIAELGATDSEQKSATESTAAEGGRTTALIDAGLQVLGAAVSAQSSEEGGGVFVPTGIGRVVLHSSLKDSSWAVARVLDRDGKSIATDGKVRGSVRFFDKAGKVLLELDDVTLSPWGASEDEEPSVTDQHELFSVDWLSLDPRPNDVAEALQSLSGSDWILLRDRDGFDGQVWTSLRTRLTESGQSVHEVLLGGPSLNTAGAPPSADAPQEGDCVGSGAVTFSAENCEQLKGFLTSWFESNRSGSNNSRKKLFVIHASGTAFSEVFENSLEVGSVDSKALRNHSFGSLKTVGEWLAGIANERQVTFSAVTRGAQVVSHAPEQGCPSQAIAWGVMRGLAGQSAQWQTRLIDLDPTDITTGDASSLLSEILIDDRHHEVALRGIERWSPRLEAWTRGNGEDDLTVLNTSENARLIVADVPTIAGLRFEQISRQAPGADQVEIHVSAAGVNFSDVLKSLGLYPTDDPDEVVPLGLECSGVVTAVGENVSRLQVGDRVIALAPYSYSRFVTVPEYGVLKCPDEITDEEGAGLLVAWATALYSLKTIGGLRRGQRVLIHSATGGVGQAAMQIVRECGGEIFATAGSPERREWLRSHGVEHVFDSRDDQFVQQILEATGGAGVDIVLNALAGELAVASFQVLRPFGRFVDLSKTDVMQNPWLDRSRFRNNLTYSCVDLDQLYRAAPVLIRDLLAELEENLVNRKLPVTAFPVTDVRQVFRTMGQRRHLGKLVLQLPPEDATANQQSLFSEDATCLIAGTEQARVLEVSRQALQQGARSLSIWTDRESFEAITSELGDGVSLKWIDSSNITSAESLRVQLQELQTSSPALSTIQFCCPVEADANAAARAIEQLSWLNEASHDLPLQGFIVFRGLIEPTPEAAGVGEFADALVVDRWQSGRPSLSVSVRPEETERLGRAFEVLDDVIRSGESRLTVAELGNESAVRALLGEERCQAGIPPLLAGLAGEVEAATRGPESTQLMSTKLSAADESARKGLLTEFFLETLSRVTSQDASRIQPETSIRRLGLDSLMTMELKNSMEKALQVKIPLSILFQDPTVEQLAGSVLGIWSGANCAAEAEPVGTKQVSEVKNG